MKVHETIIIGAGVSGLACARTLQKNKKDFLVISENIGGRILESKDGQVNYGAYYVRKDYTHIKKFVKLGKRIRPENIYLYDKNKTYTLLDFRFILNSIQAMKFVFLLIKFKKHYFKFKKRSEKVSQVQALKEDPYLINLYHQKANNFVKERGIESFSENYVNKALWGTTFLKPEEMNSFVYLEFSLPLIIPVFEFKFLKEKLISGFKKNIISGVVTKITKKKTHYELKTKNNQYCAKNVVVAASPHISKKLLNLSKINPSVQSQMFHLKGKLKENWNRGMDLFSNKEKIIAIFQQRDGSYLFYSKSKTPNFEKYFSNYKVLNHHFWNPAFNLPGNILWECKQKKNLYLIGDHNFCGLEDSYITGIYAANQIINSR